MSSEFLLTSPTVFTPSAACHVARCSAVATYTPILCVALRGSEHVSRVTLPAQVCGEHRGGFANSFLTPARRATMERSLRSRGRDSPDWSRTHLEFVVG